jgi:hypothetical protein
MYLFGNSTNRSQEGIEKGGNVDVVGTIRQVSAVSLEK